MIPKKALTKADNYRKEKYLQVCMERRHPLTPVVNYSDGITGEEALAAQRRSSTLLSFKLKQ